LTCPEPWNLAELRDRDRLLEIHPGGATVALAAAALAAGGTAPGRAGHAFFVPGRIEVLGKHTDYAGGRSLIGAIERGFGMVVLPRTDRRLRIYDVARRRNLELNVDREIGEPTRRWARYPATVVRRMARNFPGDARHRPLHGADVAFSNSLPSSAGMSSSSALVTAVYLALARINNVEDRLEYKAEIHSREDLAGYVSTIENGQSFGRLQGETGVGTLGGSEDHTGILCSAVGQLTCYRYAPVRLEKRVTLPPELVFAIAVSGVRAAKTGKARNAYNRASRMAAAAAAWWRQRTGGQEPHLAAILAKVGIDELCDVLRGGVMGGFTIEEMVVRARHFHAESEEIVPAGTDALVRRDLDAFGEVAERSQILAAEQLGNQIPETVFLAESARDGGALAASAFGAGFGGSVWALVERRKADDFLADWQDRYQTAFPSRPLKASGTGPPLREGIFFLTGAGAAATELRKNHSP
jgi:galactokinase